MIPNLDIVDASRQLGGRMVLKNISLQLQQGQFLVLAGESGSGKTTLLRMAAGLDRADGGTIKIQGKLVDDSRAMFIPSEKRRLGMVFQEFALWPHLSCLENVALAVPADTGNRNRTAMALLERLGVASFAQRRPALLSGGQQQRVGIARALAAKPNLLLLDEPLSSLDMETRDKLREELLETVRDAGISALLVSHDPEDCWLMADHVAVLEQGVIRQQGAPQDLWQAPASAYIARFTGAAGGVSIAVTTVAGDKFLDIAGTLIPIERNISSPRVRLFWREGAIQHAPHGTGIPAEAMSVHFDAGRFRVRWQVAGVARPLVSFEPAVIPIGPGHIAINPEKLFLFPETGDKHP